MDSPQSVVSPFKNSEKQAKANDARLQDDAMSSDKPYIGVLNVFIHAARDIHNICIYHKQDVYAKLFLSSDVANPVSSTIINGGGQNPVFNDQVQLRVNAVEASLRCEIWMMSRVKNYLEDQLLGFALVPLSEVLMIGDGKLEKEFTLSSTDLFHSPAGYVLLSLDYAGAKPALVMAPESAADSEISEASLIASELDKIEFPDPKIVNEDEIMVSEYIAMPCSSLDSDAAANPYSGENGLGFPAESTETVQTDSPISSTSVTAATNGVSSPSESCEVAKEDNAPAREVAKESESETSGGATSESSQPKPSSTVIASFEPKQEVVQQDIVDMYMKSMQQFTESLAKMKLPLDMEAGAAATPSPTTNSAENSTSDSKAGTGKNNRVFYGSRAFF